MLAYQAEFKVSRMASMLKVSRSGFYHWLKFGELMSQRALQQQLRAEKTQQIFIDSKQHYGATRIQVELENNQQTVCIKTINDSLRRQGLAAKAAHKFMVTTYINHKWPVAPNLLERDFTATAQHLKRVTDITYLWTNEGWLYLAVIIDLFSRAVIGWSMNFNMKAELVCDAFNMAIFRRGRPKGVIIHSARGSQYCSGDFRNLLQNYELQQGMSRKGNSWDIGSSTPARRVSSTH